MKTIVINGHNQKPRRIMKMSIFILLFSFCILPFLFMTVPLKAQELPPPGTLPINVLQTVLKKGLLIVGMESNAPPMNFVDKNSIRKGFDYELAVEIAKKIGVKVRVEEAPYEDLPELLRKGEIDIMMGGYVPDPSVEKVEWSVPYYHFGLCLIVRTSSAITDVKHLQGKTVAIYHDPSAESWVKEHIPDVNIKKFSGDSGWFEALERGDADALIYDYPFAATEILTHPRTKIVQFNLNSSFYAVGAALPNFDLLEKINRAIESIMASPIYKRLQERYLSYQSDEFTKVSGDQKKTYTVKPGDTLSLIAGKKLGNALRWTEIWELNKSRIPNPSLIQPGWVLRMPL